MTQRLDPADGRTAVGVSPDDVLWTALGEATAPTHHVLGEMGRGASGAVAFLARRRDTDALVALLVEPEGTAHGAPSYTVAEHHVLDDRVPGPCEACHTCDVPIPGWKRRCAVCGSDEMPVLPGTAPGTTRAEMLQAVRDATATQYEVLGDMPRADGGLVYFARDATSGALTVLRLLRDANAPSGATTAFALATVPLLAPPRAAPPAPAPHAIGTPTPPASPGFTLLFGGDAAASPPPTLARPSYATSALTTGGTPRSAPTGAAHQKVCPQCGTTYPADVKFCPVDGAALRPIAPTTNLVGQIIADRFHVLSKLGEGGMGEVYLAEHVQLGRRCAVKLMRQALADDAEATARFRREAKNASEIAHPNVATVFDFGATSDGITYLVMEYVDGEALSATLAREGPLAPERVASIAGQVAEALNAAHALGIVHRDLKPDNVMLAVGRDGRESVKVVDFGIAKAMEGLTQQVTRTGYRIGTPAYMSPEQIRGDVIDGRSDLYSLGCILFELLTGRRAFEGDAGDMALARRFSEAAPHPRDVEPSVPKALDEIVVRLLARSPDARFGTARELSAALAEVPIGEGTGWRLPFTGKHRTRTGATTASRITITTVDQRSAAVLHTPPPIPQSPAVAREIPGGPQPVGSYVEPPRRPVGPRGWALLVPAGVLLVVGGVAASMLLSDRGDAGPTATVATDMPAGTAPSAAGGATVAPTPPATPSSEAGAATARTDSAPTPAAVVPPPPPRTEEPARPAPTVERRPAPASPAPRGAGDAGAPTAGAVVAPLTLPPPVPTPMPAPAPARREPERQAAPAESTRPSAAQVAAESASAAARADEAGVQQVITQYLQAFDRRDAGAVKRLFPGADTRALEERSITNWSARLVQPPTVTVRGTAAEAAFSYALSFFHADMGTQRSTLAAHATLQKVGDGWRIQRLDATPR